MLIYPKEPVKKKRRMRHPASILHQQDGTCYICVRKNNDCRIHRDLETHHIFGGPNRRISEEYGFKVRLCSDHHRMGPDAVHRNMESMRLLQRDAQRQYEKKHSRRQFMDLIGRNYLDDE